MNDDSFYVHAFFDNEYEEENLRCITVDVMSYQSIDRKHINHIACHVKLRTGFVLHKVIQCLLQYEIFSIFICREMYIHLSIHLNMNIYIHSYKHLYIHT